MKLPFVGNFFKPKVQSEYFLALLFRDEKIHAVVFEQIDGRIQVIGEGKANLSVSLERASDEMLLDAADKAISIAEGPLPNNIQTHKTVFGVKETWVEDAHISKGYLSRLKTISDQLDLKPIGFLVFPEAIAHLLQREEGAPVSAILIETGMHYVTITLLRAGRIVGTKEIQLGESLTETVENALLQFENVEILPSKIVLFDTGDVKLEKAFLSHKWNKSLPFLHVPQITTLSSDFDTRAILFGTATQMGLDAIDLVKKPVETKEGIFVEEKIPVVENSSTTSEEMPGEKTEEKIEQKETPEMEETDEAMEEVVGEDTSEYFGFVKGADVAVNEENPRRTPLSENKIDEVTKEIPEVEEEEELAGEAPGFSASGAIFVNGAKKALRQLSHFSPKGFSPQSVGGIFASFISVLPGGGNKMLLVIPFLVISAIVLFLWYIFGIHAKVLLVLSPKTISQDQVITFTTTGQSDPTQNLIAATPVSVDEEGKVSGSATGTKDIGNKAKGTVTIFNSDNSSHTLSAGTTITSSNGLAFTLDNDVTIASGSSDPTNLTAGTADVSVTASDIGTDYNLPSNTKFTISGTSVLAAKNANALSGGTKQTITVVSQKDLDNLVSQLTSNLKDKAKTDLAAKVQGDEVVLPDFTKTAAGITNFDKKLDDQTSSINLDGTITFQTITYKKSDIDSYTKEALSGKLPSNSTLSQNGINYSVKDMVTKDDTTKVTLTIDAALIPTVDAKTLKDQIAGKSFAQARDILSSVPQFSDATFTLSPNLFFLPRTLPKLSGNILLTVSSHD